MTAEVVRLVLDCVGEDYRFDADAVLQGSMGKKWHKLLIIGQLDDPDDDSIYLSGNANAGESLILLECAKLDLIGR